MQYIRSQWPSRFLAGPPEDTSAMASAEAGNQYTPRSLRQNPSCRRDRHYTLQPVQVTILQARGLPSGFVKRFSIGKKCETWSLNKGIETLWTRKTHCRLFNLPRGCLACTEDETGYLDSRACEAHTRVVSTKSDTRRTRSSYKYSQLWGLGGNFSLEMSCRDIIADD